MDDLEERLDDLYAGPAGEFTSRRAALVKDLRTAGEGEEAERVGALRRPTKLAAQLNALARDRTEAMEAAIGAEEALASAQRQMLEGGGSADDLRAATEAEAAAVAELSDDPEVRAAIRAAARRPDEREELRRGRLSRDPQPDLSAGLLLGGPPAPPVTPSARPRRATAVEPAPEPSGVDELAARRQDRAERAEAARESALAEARELAAAAVDNERRSGERLAQSREGRERAERERDDAEEAAARLREELAAAERETASRRKAAAEAARAEDRATGEAAEARRLVAEAERVLAQLEDDALES
jgi:hypothetical protein